MRQITKDLRAVATSVAAYEAGRAAFREGVSLTDLPRSDWDLLRSGWLDELADTVQLLVRDADHSLGAINSVSRAATFACRTPSVAPPATAPEKPLSTYRPLDHGPTPAAAPDALRVTGAVIVAPALAHPAKPIGD